MANDSIQAELEQLRTQLEALRRAEADRAASGERNDAADAPEEPGDDDGGSELLAQFRELLDSLDEELKESNPTTLLAVFTLGILVGRLLPR